MMFGGIGMDLTDRINEFREAARHLWNTHFRHDAKNQDWDLHDAFSEVYVALFNALVRYNLPDTAPSIPHLWDPGNTVLYQYRISAYSDRLPLVVNRTKPASGYWDHPTCIVDTSSVDLRLIAFFDWDNLGFKELRYFRIRIVKADDPDLMDRDALVETAYCRIEYVEERK
jgi:hypothetical protein